MNTINKPHFVKSYSAHVLAKDRREARLASILKPFQWLTDSFYFILKLFNYKALHGLAPFFTFLNQGWGEGGTNIFTMLLLAVFL